MIHSIQIFRGIAALLVLLFHSGYYAERYGSESFLAAVFSFGHAGVEFFFVLSGFVIYLIHKKDLHTPQRADNYLKKRFLRIYPTFFVTHVFLVMVYTVLEKKSIIAFMKALIFLPHENSFYLTVAWSITYEVVFYLLFLLFILLPLRSAIGISIVVCCILFFSTVIPFEPGYLAMFIAGVVAVELRSRVAWLAESRIVFLAGNLIFLASGYLEVRQGLNFGFGYALGAFLILVSCTTFENFFERRKFLLYLGEASYSIYLFHTIALSFVARLVPKNIQADLFFAICAATALVICLVFYFLFEKNQKIYLGLLSGRKQKY